MATFFMFGNYTPESLKQISAGRTAKATKAIERLGGKVKSIHALLGSHDLVLIVDLPGVEKAVEASVALNRLTGIGFSTAPAIEVEKFDALVGKR